ncbi:protein pxr1 [Fagus crenata]
MACTIDFRGLDEGFGGKTYKRKRAEAEHNLVSGSASMDIDEEYTFQPATKRSAVASAENPDKPSFGKPSYDGVISGRVSGRNWKQPRKHRASATQVRKGTPFEERARDKEIKKAYKERMTELKETIRQNKIEKRKAREKREKTKKENILKSGTKLQKITNPKTLKKIAKSKHKNLLKAAIVALIGVKRAASEPVDFEGKVVSGEKFIEGVKGRRVGAMLRAAAF